MHHQRSVTQPDFQPTRQRLNFTPIIPRPWVIWPKMTVPDSIQSKIQELIFYRLYFATQCSIDTETQCANDKHKEKNVGPNNHEIDGMPINPNRPSAICIRLRDVIDRVITKSAVDCPVILRSDGLIRSAETRTRHLLIFERSTQRSHASDKLPTRNFAFTALSEMLNVHPIFRSVPLSFYF